MIDRAFNSSVAGTLSESVNQCLPFPFLPQFVRFIPLTPTALPRASIIYYIFIIVVETINWDDEQLKRPSTLTRGRYYPSSSVTCVYPSEAHGQITTYGDTHMMSSARLQ